MKNLASNASWFRDAPHRWAAASLPLVYGVACVEVVFKNSEKAGANTNDELQKAEARLLRLERMEKNLQRLALEEEISFGDFKGHRVQIESERARLNITVDSIKQRQHLVKADFEIALQLSTELSFLFEEGNFDEKRLLCETVFKRLMIKEGTIENIEFNSPFSLIAAQAKSSGTVSIGVPWATVPELLFEKKGLLPDIQRLLISH